MEDGACIPLRVHTVVISTQHDEDISLEEQRRQLKEEIIKVRVRGVRIYNCVLKCVWLPSLLKTSLPLLPPSSKKVIPAQYLDDDTVYHIQPSGSFVVGGPQVCHMTIT